MKLKLNLTQFYDLADRKFWDYLQLQYLVCAFTYKQKITMPYITKTQLKTLRKMGCVKLA